MRKLIIVILLIKPMLLFAGGIVFKIKSFDAKKTSEGSYNFTCTIHTSGLFIDTEGNPSVKIPADALLISYQFKKLELHESDLLFSQNRKDLNNDGDFNDVFTIKKDRKGLYHIGKYPITTLKGKKSYSGLVVYNYFDDNNRIKAIRAVENGAPFLIYDLNEKKDIIIAGFTNQKSSYPFIDIPNPSIEISLATEEVSTKTGKKIDIPGGIYSNTRTNIKYFQDQADAFVTLNKCYIPMKPDKNGNFTFTGTISNIPKVAILGIKLHFSPGDNLVLQTRETRYVLKR